MNIYNNMYELVQTYLFGGDVLTSNMDLIATAIATFGVIAIVGVPFIILAKVIAMVLNI